MSKTMVYLADISGLENIDLFNKFYLRMPLYRREKIDRYKFNKDKLLSLGAGVLLKMACVDFGISGQDENIIFNEYEKPFFNNSNLFFNLSHSNKKVMCSISNSLVGCDIEKIRKFKEGILNKVFSKSEIEVFNVKDINSFYKLWTIKESYIKKCGKGFFINPLSFEVERKDKIAIKGDNKTLFYVGEIEDYKYAVSYFTDEIEIKNIDLVNVSI